MSISKQGGIGERPPAIEVSGLRKTYAGGVEAVAGIDFTVLTGEVFGLEQYVVAAAAALFPIIFFEPLVLLWPAFMSLRASLNRARAVAWSCALDCDCARADRAGTTASIATTSAARRGRSHVVIRIGSGQGAGGGRRGGR